MATKLQLKADKKSINKGESVNVNWSSDTPDSLVLIIDDGDSVQKFQVSDSGSRLCWSNRAVKDLKITLAGTFAGKKEREEITIKVRNKRNNAGNKSGISKFQMWKEKNEARRSVAKAQFAYTWASLKTWQKILYVLAMALPVVLLAIIVFK